MAPTLAAKCTTSPDKENILDLLQKSENEMVDKTEYVQVCDTEEKAASLKQKMNQKALRYNLRLQH
eukprot:13130097-Ditylum_brightwellii.AAC.1